MTRVSPGGDQRDRKGPEEAKKIKSINPLALSRKVQNACIDSDCSSLSPCLPARAPQPTAVTLDSLG